MENRLTRYIAKTFMGLESVAADELRKLGAKDVSLLHRAVEFWGDKALMYKVNYCCRTILRVLQPVAVFEFHTNEQYYRRIFNIPFEKYISGKGSFCMHALTNQSIFSNAQYASLLAKDALCDRFRDKYNCRPNVDKQYPQLIVDIYISGSQCSVSLDTSGSALYMRGYKTTRHFSALNEVLAAGLIALSGWKADCDFIDFMCGSATLPIEAAMLATNMPAAYFRNDFGFLHWLDFDENLWNKVRDEADAAMHDFQHRIYGSDISFRYIKDAKENIKKMHLDKFISLAVESFEDTEPEHIPSMIIVNPPYGERMKLEDVENFYQNAGNILKKKYIYCIAWVLTSNKEAMKSFGLHPAKKINLLNGDIECVFYKYELYEGSKKLKFKN